MAREAVTANPRVLKDPAASIGVAEVGESAIKVAIYPRVAVSDFAVAEAELYQSLIERFRAQGIGSPLPRHEVRLVNGARSA